MTQEEYLLIPLSSKYFHYRSFHKVTGNVQHGDVIEYTEAE